MRPWRRWMGAEAVPVGLDDGYARWAPHYPPHAHNPLMQLEEQHVVRILSRLRASRALDVGTGTGRCLPLLRNVAGAARVVGLDRSPAMLARADASAPRVCADSGRLPFAGSTFDLVNASLMVGDVPSVAEWARELAAVMVTGGHLVYSDFHPSWTERGWRRTFDDGEQKRYELPFMPHTIDEHRRSLANAGFVVLDLTEARLPERPAPLLVVVHATKAR